MSNKILIVRKSINVKNHQELATFAANKERYVGKFNCKKPTVRVYEGNLLYVGKYPRTCPTGDSYKDTRYFIPLPGYDHPHVIMIDDEFYTVNIDMP